MLLARSNLTHTLFVTFLNIVADSHVFVNYPFCSLPHQAMWFSSCYSEATALKEQWGLRSSVSHNDPIWFCSRWCTNQYYRNLNRPDTFAFLSRIPNAASNLSLVELGKLNTSFWFSWFFLYCDLLCVSDIVLPPEHEQWIKAFESKAFQSAFHDWTLLERIYFCYRCELCHASCGPNGSQVRGIPDGVDWPNTDRSSHFNLTIFSIVSGFVYGLQALEVSCVAPLRHQAFNGYSICLVCDSDTALILINQINIPSLSCGRCWSRLAAVQSVMNLFLGNCILRWEPVIGSSIATGMTYNNQLCHI